MDATPDVCLQSSIRRNLLPGNLGRNLNAGWSRQSAKASKEDDRRSLLQITVVDDYPEECFIGMKEIIKGRMLTFLEQGLVVFLTQNAAIPISTIESRKNPVEALRNVLEETTKGFKKFLDADPKGIYT